MQISNKIDSEKTKLSNKFDELELFLKQVFLKTSLLK